jgi:signal transduction histidine kinase
VIAVAGVRLDTDQSRRLAALTAAGFLVAGSFAHPAISPTQAVSVLPAFLFTYLASAATRRLRLEQQRTAELLEEVVAGRDAVIRAAALDERAHLAREMHDVLAHTLSALSIQLEGTRLLAEQRGCDPEIMAALERTSGLSREGLGEARRAVGSLRGEALPGPDLLPELAREFEQDTGVPCRVEIEGEPADLSAEARLALYRIAQEALTNVRKHADATNVMLSLCYATGGVELVVDDEGTPRDSPLPGGGYGMSGMRERAALLHGTLDAAPTPTGFRVRLWIPTTTSLSAS